MILSFGEANIHHCARGYSSSTARVILVSFLKPFGPAMPWRPSRRFGETNAVDVAVEDRLLVVAVLSEPLDLFTLDGERALVFLDAVPVEDADFDDGALHSRRNRSEVSRTSEAFSPKMARRSFSSGVMGTSPFGVILPTRMSPARTSAPI